MGLAIAAFGTVFTSGVTVAAVHVQAACNWAVMKAIENLGDDLTVIIVAHRLTTLKNCTQIVELEDGRIKRTGSYQNVIGD